MFIFPRCKSLTSKFFIEIYHNTIRPADLGLVRELSLFRGFPRSLYSFRSPDAPKFFFKLSVVEKVVFWATPISRVGKFITSLGNGVKT